MRGGDESRECKDCGRALPLRFFEKSRRTCYKCRNINNRYGISGRQFFKILEDQMNCCLICENPINERTAVVDHCHDSQNIRSLLCHNCNVGIGHLKHNHEYVYRAFEYLRFFK